MYITANAFSKRHVGNLSMIVRGIDFTSSPSQRKPLTCFEGLLDGDKLTFKENYRWHSFEEFEDALSSPGPWIAGIDFPFGQARKFVENIGWPRQWAEYVTLVGSFSRQEFRDTLEEFKASRPFGDKELRRKTDVAAGAISPQKLYGVPVALMFYEGAPRLVEAAVTIPGLQTGDPERIVVEAYPGVLARQLIGRRPHKHDKPNSQTREQYEARTEIMEMIVSGQLESSHGIEVEAPMELADDPSGDDLDALLCAIQAAWAWNMRSENYGMPRDHDALEGWIADPKACGTGARPNLGKIRSANPTIENRGSGPAATGLQTRHVGRGPNERPPEPRVEMLDESPAEAAQEVPIQAPLEKENAPSVAPQPAATPSAKDRDPDLWAEEAGTMEDAAPPARGELAETRISEPLANVKALDKKSFMERLGFLVRTLIRRYRRK